MRVSREQAAKNRERIVETAARLFREKGFDGVGLDAIMKDVGLTHGGFYGHFKSKEDLASEAVVRALEASAERMSGHETLHDYARAYLSERHCAEPGKGCVVAALGADMSRQGTGVRRGLSSFLNRRFGRLADLIKHGSPARRRRRAIATFAGLVGAITLARAVDDPALAKEILAAAREMYATEQT